MCSHAAGVCRGQCRPHDRWVAAALGSSWPLGVGRRCLGSVAALAAELLGMGAGGLPGWCETAGTHPRGLATESSDSGALGPASVSTTAKGVSETKQMEQIKHLP